MKCIKCGETLIGRQTKFCSRSCKDVYTGRSRYKLKANECNEKNRKWREKNKDKIAESKRRYYQRHREKLLLKRRKYAKEHPETDYRYKKSLKGQYMIYRRGANKRGYEFSITIDDFEKHWNGVCAYCGDTIEGIGLDRIDNNVGYTKENIVPCCTICNRMKNSHSREEFINHCKKVSLLA